MVNPGSFRGARRDFLLGEKPAYAAGVVGGYAGDALALIQRRYFKRFPVSLSHETEPSANDLAAVDDDSPDEEYCLPDRDAVGEEEYELAVKALEERSKLVQFRKAQIKRWLAYQYMKDNDVDPKDSGADNPYRVLLHKLTGVGISRPRAKSTVNIWRKLHKTTIDDEVLRRIAQAGPGATKKKDLAALRDKVARDLFSALTAEEQDEWKERAREEHEVALARWKNDTEGPPSKEPEDRQRCIQGLVQFVQPILDVICEATGWSATLVAGGPEPADGGRLNIVSVHSGTTSGDVKMNFGRADRLRFKKIWVPIYGQFLQKCYTLDECRARALPIDEGHLALSGLDLWNDENATFDSVVTPAASAPRIPPFPNPSATTNSPPTPSYPVTTSHAAPSQQQTSIGIVHDPSPYPPAHTPARSARSLSPEALLSPPMPATPGLLALPRPHTRPNSHQPSPSGSPPPSPSGSPPPSPPGSPPPSHSPLPSHAPHQEDFPHQLPPLPRHSSSTAAPKAVSQGRRAEGGSVVNGNPPSPQQPASDALENTAGKRRTRSHTAAGKSGDPAPPSKRMRTGLSEAKGGGKRTRAQVAAGASPAGIRLRPSQHLRSSGRNAHTSASNVPNKVVPKSKTRMMSSTESAQAPPSDNASRVPASTSEVQDISIKYPNAPAWFAKAYSMLMDESLGLRWRELVDVWAEFEKQEGYQESLKLKTTHRPSAVAEWIRRARSTTWRPDIDNLIAFEEDMREWWTVLQPAWRVCDGAIALDKLEGNWESLRCPGINGLLGVLAALFYWGQHIKENGDDEVLWLELVSDCCAVMSRLLA